MQMSLRSRLLDLLPVLVVFAVVTLFATFVVIEYVIRQPLVVPPPQQGEPLAPETTGSH